MFHNGKFMFAIYTLDDTLVDVCDNRKQLQNFIGKKVSNSTICRSITENRPMRCQNYRIFPINCIEEHNDCFEKEDKEFASIFNNTSSSKEFVKSTGLSISTYFRRKKLGLIKKENELCR